MRWDIFHGPEFEIWTGLGRLAGSEFTNVLLFYQVKLNASQNFYKMCKKFINCKLPTWPKPARTSDFDLEKYLTRTYRIVAIKSTCYYSENQIFCFLKSRIPTCRIFLGIKLFLFVKIERLDKRMMCLSSNFFSAHSDFIHFLPPM